MRDQNLKRNPQCHNTIIEEKGYRGSLSRVAHIRRADHKSATANEARNGTFHPPPPTTPLNFERQKEEKTPSPYLIFGGSNFVASRRREKENEKEVAICERLLPLQTASISMSPASTSNSKLHSSAPSWPVFTHISRYIIEAGGGQTVCICFVDFGVFR